MNRKKISLTQDRIALVKKELGIQLTAVGKLCDFCDQSLPAHHKSVQCVLCPTIFDICAVCENLRLEKSRSKEINSICHLSHENMSLQKNDALTTIEKQQIAGLYTPNFFVYVENLEKSPFCKYCEENFENPEQFDEKKCEKYKSFYTSLKKLLSSQMKICESVKSLLEKKYNCLVHCVQTCNSLAISI